MRPDAKGTVLYEGTKQVDAERVSKLAEALGTNSAPQTALLVPFFGPTVGGEDCVVDPDGLGLDLSHTLLGGVSYECARAFRPDESVHVRVHVENTFAKGANDFAVVASEFTGDDGDLIQRQTATFIERRND